MPATIHKIQFDPAAEGEPAHPAPDAEAPAAPPATAVSVYDAESKEVVTVTPEMQRRAAQVQRYIEMSALVQAAGIRIVADERLYLAYGCSSFKEYAETMLPVGYSAAKQLLTIGRRLAPLLPGLGEGEPAHLALTSGDGAEGEPAHLDGAARDLAGLGPSKLYEIVRRMDDDDLADAVDARELTLPSGKTVTFVELQEMTRAEIRKEFREERRALRDKTARLEEENKLLRAEAEANDKTIADAERKHARAEQIESRYGPAAGRAAEKEHQMGRARDLMNELAETLTKVGVTLGDPEEYWHDLADLRRKLGGVSERFAAQYSEVFYSVDAHLAADVEVGA